VRGECGLPRLEMWLGARYWPDWLTVRSIPAKEVSCLTFSRRSMHRIWARKRAEVVSPIPGTLAVEFQAWGSFR